MSLLPGKSGKGQWRVINLGVYEIKKERACIEKDGANLHALHPGSKLRSSLRFPFI